MLTEDTILDIAEAHSKSGAQKAAAANALRAAMELLPDTPAVSAGAPEGTIGEAIPTSPVLVCISSTAEVPSSQYKELWPRLDAALTMFGRVEVVTFGGRGNEQLAHKWAKARGQVVREFAVCWTRPQPDGTTTRDSRAVARRNALLQSYVEKAEHVYSLVYGDPAERSYRRVKAVHDLLEKWGANAQPRVAEEAGS